MIKVAIVGGTGYTAGELIRILIAHPAVEIVSVFSTSAAREPVAKVHTDLYGDTDLCFCDSLNNPDVVFLCLGHGVSREFIENHPIAPSCKIIDLGNDFRIEPDFKGRHFVYGLSDSFRQEIVNACSIANPGCFATAIQNAVLPLVKAGLVRDDIQVTAITGSTGAGKKESATSHFSWRSNNISIYKLFKHQHLGEINRSIKRLSEGLSHSAVAKVPRVNFVPLRGDFARGILASVYTKWYGKASDNKEDATIEARRIFKEYYKDSPFTFIADNDISLKDVVNTNKSLLHIEVIDNLIHITSVIDNLIKGAAGQAVENMNLMFKRPEAEGLRLKPSAF